MDDQAEMKRPVDVRASTPGSLVAVVVTIGLVVAAVAPSLSVASAAEKGPGSSRAQDLIIGKWWAMAGSQTVTMEFARDGTYKSTVGGQTTIGTYKWLDDGTIELNGREKVKIVVSQDDVIMTIGNERSSFKREKTAAAPAAEGPIITRLVMAKRMTPLSQTPVEVTDEFPSNQGAIHAVVTVSNAPAGTRLKATWMTGTANPPNTKVMQSDESIVEGSGNLGFGLQNTSFPLGTYKVDISLNGKLNRTVNFSVVKEAPLGPAPTPGVIGSCPQLPPRDAKPPGFPIGVTMAQGTTGPQLEPVNPGRIFRPDSVVHAVVTTQNAPANTQVAGRWFAADLGGVEPCNTEIGKHSAAASAGSGKIDFTSAPPPGVKWPEGLYRVEVYVNGNLTLETDFGVCEGPCRFKVPLSWELP